MTGQALWFISRGSGLVLLALFSVVIVLGAAARLGSAPRRWARFTVSEVHRTLSLFSVALLALHVATAILDPYVKIGWAALVVPFASHYETLAIGLGTLAVDIGAAILLTTAFRRRLGQKAWKAIHFLAYAAWPLAFWHSLTAATYDLGVWWVALILWGSLATALTGVIARLLNRRRPDAEGVRPGLADRASQIRRASGASAA